MILGKSSPSCILQLCVEDSGTDPLPNYDNFGKHLKDRCGALRENPGRRKCWRGRAKALREEGTWLISGAAGSPAQRR